MKRIGYAQVEPNHLSARYTGQIYAQLPAMTATTSGGVTTVTPIPQLENGQFLKYNYAAGRASIDGDGEWMLVYNEEKLYDERRQNHKDFVIKATDMTDGKIYPRLLKTNVGDILTTNAFKATSGGPSVSGPDEEITMADLSIGDLVVVGDDGWLKKSTAAIGSLDAPVFKVVPHFTQIKDNGSITPAYETKTIGSESVIVYNYTLPDMQDAVKLQRVK
jgi:hypothetical protein